MAMFVGKRFRPMEYMPGLMHAINQLHLAKPASLPFGTSEGRYIPIRHELQGFGHCESIEYSRMDRPDSKLE
jgi:hypothetical protein